MTPPNRRLAGSASRFAAEAGEAAELEREELLVDPHLAAVAALGVVAKAEVEYVAAAIADREIGVGQMAAADVAGGWVRHGSIVA
jgi:hypothetical protein